MNLLFVCARNRRRSPTAEALFAGVGGVETDSAGLSPDAEQRLAAEQVAWADIVFVMERRHRSALTRGFGAALRGKRVVCLGIPDDYAFDDPELIGLLWERVPRSVPALVAARPGTHQSARQMHTHRPERPPQGLRTMQKKTLGDSDLHVTTIGFGSWAIGGGDWKFGWGHQDDGHSVQVIHEAVEQGVNWIDTAPVYGHGHSEEVVGRALAEMPAGRRPMVFTKCGHPWDDKGDLHYSLKAADLRQECEDSLRRLGVERIDLYQFHWPKPEEELEEGWQTLQELKAEGKIRYAGVCNFSVEQMKKVTPIGPITSHQMHYSLLRPNVERDELPYCQEHGVGVLAYSPMGSGLLTGTMTREYLANLPDNDWRKKGHPHYQEPLLTRNLNLVDLLRRIGDKHGKIPGATAVAWVLSHPGVTATILGAREPGQFHEPAAAADWQLTPAEVTELRDFLTANPAKAWGD